MHAKAFEQIQKLSQAVSLAKFAPGPGGVDPIREQREARREHRERPRLPPRGLAGEAPRRALQLVQAGRGGPNFGCIKAARQNLIVQQFSRSTIFTRGCTFLNPI